MKKIDVRLRDCNTTHLPVKPTDTGVLWILIDDITSIEIIDDITVIGMSNGGYIHVEEGFFDIIEKISLFRRLRDYVE